MSILSWNCRGLRQSRAVQELLAPTRAKSSSMVFLKTRHSAKRAMNLKWRLGLKNSVGVDSIGQGGGLVLFWHESLHVVLLGMNSHFIDVHVKDSDSKLWYRITFVYGEPRTEQRHLMRETMCRLHVGGGF
jgi:hypothetical protein